VQNRLEFFSCIIGAAIGLAAAGSGALAQTAAISRTTLQQTEYPDGKHVCIQQLLEIAPNTPVIRHTHPGIEWGYLLSGNLTLSIQGQPDRLLKAGDSYLIPLEAPHNGHAGPEPLRVVANFCVEKGKPLLAPVPQ
jgi:quercetin dioxygenase-like cupin family protein